MASSLPQRKLDNTYSKDRHPAASPEFLDVLKGKVEYIRMVRGPDDRIAQRFATQISNILQGKERNEGIPVVEGVGEVGTKRAFLSYVHEDSGRVDSLEKSLTESGIPVWRDVNDLWPGEDWRTKIREAIQHGSFAFVACISAASNAKTRSGMNEELTFAADEHRVRNPAVPWMFPVLLDDVAPTTLRPRRWQNAEQPSVGSVAQELEARGGATGDESSAIGPLI